MTHRLGGTADSPEIFEVIVDIVDLGVGEHYIGRLERVLRPATCGSTPFQLLWWPLSYDNRRLLPDPIDRDGAVAFLLEEWRRTGHDDGGSDCAMRWP